MARTFVDLAHAVTNGVVTYRGLPAPSICDFLTRSASRQMYAPGTEFQIGSITMVGNTGTYVDAPFHRYVDGADLADMPLSSLAELPGVVVDLPADRVALTAADLRKHDLTGAAVLVRTGWSRHYGADAYFDGHPFVTAEAARVLVAARAALVGIDSLNIDDIADVARPVHSHLLAAGIPIVEHLTGLAALPRSGFTFSAVPARVRAFGTFPVRAYARL